MVLLSFLLLGIRLFPWSLATLIPASISCCGWLSNNDRIWRTSFMFLPVLLREGEREEKACKSLPAVMKTVLIFCPLITHLHVAISAMWGFISFSWPHLTLTILLRSVWNEEDKLQWSLKVISWMNLTLRKNTAVVWHLIRVPPVLMPI